MLPEVIEVVSEHDPVAGVPRTETRQGIVCLREGKLLHHRRNVMPRAKIERCSRVAGLPAVDPVTLRCCIRRGSAATGTGSSVAPSRTSRPFGESASIIIGQPIGASTVEMMRSSVPATFDIASGLRDSKT